MSTENATKQGNRLLHETSPYLLQHAHNPVDWYPWGPEALERARSARRPILLSIGYSACHWCHVMERESFEDPEIAAVMNRAFVCVKVDREERPDLDGIYMSATVAMSGAGGWPMTVFLTPEQEPFFAGTYFPPRPRRGQPGFLELLEHIEALWQSAPERAIEQGRALREALAEQAKPAAPAAVGQARIDEAVVALAASFDATHGGFGGAPKFPAPAAISLLLRQHVRTGDLDAKKMALKTLDAMAAGGIYDQLGGGFARYATDARWLVPHFEKMLYDNAQLARVYLEGFQVSHDPAHARVARETLDYALRELRSPSGAFYSSTDADSEGVEGKYFVFDEAELVEALGEEEARLFCAYYDVTAEGNWEGKNVLNTPRSLASVARPLGLKPDHAAARLEAARAQVLALRASRVPPARDDKILTSWNGLMIAALAEGARVLGEARYLEAAAAAAEDLLCRMRREDGGLYRSARAGRAQVEAFLDDYAYFADALLDLYEAGGPRGSLAEATRLAERIVSDFREPRGGGFYQSAASAEALIVRPLEAHDDATPSAVAVAARLLARLSSQLERPGLRDIAEEALRAHGAAMSGGAARAFCTALGVVDLLLEGPVELVFAGERGDPALEALVREAARRPLPNRVIGWVDRATPARAEGLLEGRAPHEGPPQAYVCRRGVCKAPVRAPGKLGHAIDAARREAARERAEGLPQARLPGRARVEGTRRRAAHHEALSGRAGGFGPFGGSGLMASRLGFGAYRVSDDSELQRAALAKALRLGVNLIDTSANYMDGGSERLIGGLLAELSRGGEMSREELIVVSKAGYLQGRGLDAAKARAAAGEGYESLVEVDAGLWHCMHPSALAESLEASLERLGLETLDVLLLHNPEHFFTHEEGDREEARGRLYALLEEAFRYLEAEVERGRIAAYGVSSNTLAHPAEAPDAIDLGRLLEAASAAGGLGHHLRVIELPMNLLEPEAYLERGAIARSGRSVLEEAAARGLAVLVNRPLNAIVDGQLFRLADPPLHVGCAPFEDALAAVAELEAEFREHIAPRLELPSGADPAGLFRWAPRLEGILARLDAGSDWKKMELSQIRPELDQRVEALNRAGRYAPELAPLWDAFRRRYVPAVRSLLGSISAHVAALRRGQASGLRELLGPSLGEEARAAPLSQLAVQVLCSTPGVTTVLAGMREPAYVDDLLAVMASGPLPGWEEIATRRPLREEATEL